MRQSEVRGDHLGEIEAHALEEVRLQRHCNRSEEDHIRYSPPARLGVKSAAAALDSAAQIKQGKRKGGLTEGLALDLLIRDGARKVEVVHLLLGRLLLMGLRRRDGGGVSGSEGGRSRRVCGRRGRGPGLADGGAHGGGGGACD